MSASLKQTAELIWCLLDEGVLDVPQVVQWADFMITSTDTPPYWLIELSLCDERYAALEVLRRVPGEYSEQALAQQLLAVLARREEKHSERWKELVRLLGNIAVVRGAGSSRGPLGLWFLWHQLIDDAEDYGEAPPWDTIREELERELSTSRNFPLPDNFGPLLQDLR